MRERAASQLADQPDADRARSPCAARWCGSPSDFSPAKRSAANPASILSSRAIASRMCSALSPAPPSASAVQSARQDLLQRLGNRDRLVPQRRQSPAPLFENRRVGSRGSEGASVERRSRHRYQPQQALLKRDGRGKIGRNCSDFGPSCRCAAPETRRGEGRATERSIV